MYLYMRVIYFCVCDGQMVLLYVAIYAGHLFGGSRVFNLHIPYFISYFFAGGIFFYLFDENSILRKSGGAYFPFLNGVILSSGGLG